MPTRVLQEVPESAEAAAVPPQSDQPQQQLVVTTAAAPVQHQKQQIAAPVLKLSFGGVDFSLLPKTSRDGSVTFEAMGATEAVLSLKNFTGKLQVSCASLTQNLVEDSTSPSPQHQALEHRRRKSPTQQQISSWATRKNASSPPAAAAATTNKDQAPTPTVANGKKRSSDVDQVRAATRSSPLPYHSPLKRSRRSSQSPERKSTPLTQKLPPSPISLAQKSQSTIDCSQTIQTSPTSSTPAEEDQEMQEASTATKSNEDEEKEDTKKDSVQEIMKRNESHCSGSEDEGVEEEEDDDEENQSPSKQSQDDTEEDGDRDSEDEDEDETQLPGEMQSPFKMAFSPTQEIVSKAIKENATKKPLNEPPCPRWGHTFTNVGNNRAILYGGQSFDPKTNKPITLADVYIFDANKRTWVKPMTSESSWPRQWHSATFLPQRQLLVCFGGEAANPKTGRVTTSDKNNCMVLDTEIMLFYPPSTTGECPSGRSGHTATLLPSSPNNEIVVFGGVKGAKWLNNVSVLDTTRWIWSSIKPEGVPPKARSYHSAIAVEAVVNEEFTQDDLENQNATSVKVCSRIVIFGGNDATTSFNGVHVLEKTEGPSPSWRWFHPTVNGTPPKARTGASATLLEDGKTICIYGGWDPNEDEDDAENKNPAEDDKDIIFKDCFLLDTETWSWKSGPTPVFAGDSMDPSEGEDGGARRVGHTAVLNPTKKGENEVLVFGGRVPGDRFTGDFQTLTI